MMFDGMYSQVSAHVKLHMMDLHAHDPAIRSRGHGLMHTCVNGLNPEGDNGVRP